MEISETRATFGATTYPIGTISSVTVVEIPPDRGTGALIAGAGGIALVLTWSLLGWPWMALSVCVILVGVERMRAQRATYGVQITSAGTWSLAYVSAERAYAERVREALAEAIDRASRSP